MEREREKERDKLTINKNKISFRVGEPTKRLNQFFSLIYLKILFRL